MQGLDHKHDEIVDLEKRLKKLEEQFDVLKSMADPDRTPFRYACLEANMDADQMDRTVALLNKASATMMTNEPMNWDEFRGDLYAIVPQQKKNPEFPKSIIEALHKKFKYDRLYEHFKGSWKE